MEHILQTRIICFQVLFFYDAANVQIGAVVELPEKYAFSKGFGYFNEGVNPAVKNKYFRNKHYI